MSSKQIYILSSAGRFFLPWFNALDFQPRNLDLFTSREHIFDHRPKWALVLAFFTPGTRDTFSPGWWHQPRLKVPPLYPGRLLLPPRARAQHILKLTALVFLLPPSLHCSSIHYSIPPSISSIPPSILQL